MPLALAAAPIVTAANSAVVASLTGTTPAFIQTTKELLKLTLFINPLTPMYSAWMNMAIGASPLAMGTKVGSGPNWVESFIDTTMTISYTNFVAMVLTPAFSALITAIVPPIITAVQSAVVNIPATGSPGGPSVGVLI